jgi:aflatoxin B1 aldehyde reductase
MYGGYKVRVSTEVAKEVLILLCRTYPQAPGDFAADKIRASIEASIKALGKTKIRTFYLHMPDRSVPIEDTLRGVNELYKEGLL